MKNIYGHIRTVEFYQFIPQTGWGELPAGIGQRRLGKDVSTNTALISGLLLPISRNRRL
jgi:hypothetical protein